MATVRPSWQLDACPSWCVGGHHETDHPEDHLHRSTSFSVPVVFRRTRLDGGDLVQTAESGEFEVALSCTDGDPETWLYLGDGPGMSLELSTESARRLLAAALARLGTLDVARVSGT